MGFVWLLPRGARLRNRIHLFRLYICPCFFSPRFLDVCPLFNAFHVQEHIAERLLPVKERMIQQLGTPSRRTNPCAGASEGRNGQINVGCELSLSGEMAGDGTGAVSAESAVSDAWIEASKTAGVDSGLAPPTSSMASSLTKPCSALSLVELDLCGDADEDDCPGAFLVDSCDDDGSGIGLDLYDLDQVNFVWKLLSRRSHLVLGKN